MIKYRKLKNLLIWKCKQKKVAQLPTATRMAEIEEVEPPAPLVLLPCTSCNRTFRPDALAKHAKVCEKTLMKKRKKFDSSKQRLQGTDVPQFPPPPKQKESPLKPIPQSKWREKQAELARSLSSVRKKSGVTLPVKPSDHEQCPFCERHFGPKAYDRHTEWCKEQHTKLKNNNINIEARERLQVRTKYRAPLSNKVLTRDKYLPRSRDPSPLGLTMIQAEDQVKQKLPSPLNRSQSLRMNGRSRSMVAKTSPTVPAAELRNTNIRSHTSSINVRARGVPKSPKEPERASVSTNGENTKPRIVSNNNNPKKDIAKYDPFASAEQQMLELFGAAQQAVAVQSSPVQSPKEDPKDSETSLPPDNIPSSAFAIYTPKPRRTSVDSVQSDNTTRSDNTNRTYNKGNNNIDGASDGTLSPVSPPMDKNKNFSLSNLSLCSIISIDSVDCNRNPVIKSYKMRDEPLQRSFSAVEGKHGRNRVKVNMQQMLYGFDSPERRTSPNKVDVGNLEACEAELIVSMMEFEKMLNNSPVPTSDQSSPSPDNQKPAEIGSLKSPEEDHESKSAVPTSIDSAYSSLTRASSGEGDSAKMDPPKFGGGDSAKMDPPRFCHECGAKYPVAMAKFCCNCGIRRIAI